MNKIISKQGLAAQIKKMIIQAPEIANKVLPGQFVVIIAEEKGERIPLTVVESYKDKGLITIIFQEVGKTTAYLGGLKTGDQIYGLLGPLGKPAEIQKLGTVVMVGGGVGIAEVYPVARAFADAGNKVISIIGARTKELLILEKELSNVSDQLFITTDDGSSGRKGFVSDALAEIIIQRKVNLVYAVGPVPMMKAVSEITAPDKIATRVCLNPIMVDATGMCGACRVNIGKEVKFGCVDGPAFDGHLVDFDQLNKRLKQFLAQEKQALER